MKKISQIVSELLVKIEKLEHDFNFYFTAQEKKPPLRALESLKKEVDILMKISADSKNTAERHLALQLINRFTVYRQKWEKGVIDIEEGRAKPGLGFFGGLGIGRSQFSDLRSSLNDLEKQDAEAFKMSAIIDQTANKFIELSQKFTNKTYSREAVAEMLEKKIGDIRQKFGDNFTFDVFYEDGKVKIKPRRD